MKIIISRKNEVIKFPVSWNINVARNKNPLISSYTKDALDMLYIFKMKNAFVIQKKYK